MNEINTDKLVADSKILIDDLEELVAATAGQAGARVAELLQGLERKIAAGRVLLSKYETELRNQVDRAQARAVTYLRQESWSRLMIAATIALAVGLALRRSR